MFVLSFWNDSLYSVPFITGNETSTSQAGPKCLNKRAKQNPRTGMVNKSTWKEEHIQEYLATISFFLILHFLPVISNRKTNTVISLLVPFVEEKLFHRTFVEKKISSCLLALFLEQDYECILNKSRSNIKQYHENMSVKSLLQLFGTYILLLSKNQEMWVMIVWLFSILFSSS